MGSKRVKFLCVANCLKKLAWTWKSTTANTRYRVASAGNGAEEDKNATLKGTAAKFISGKVSVSVYFRMSIQNF